MSKFRDIEKRSISSLIIATVLAIIVLIISIF